MSRTIIESKQKRPAIALRPNNIFCGMPLLGRKKGKTKPVIKAVNAAPKASIRKMVGIFNDSKYDFKSKRYFFQLINIYKYKISVIYYSNFENLKNR